MQSPFGIRRLAHRLSRDPRTVVAGNFTSLGLSTVRNVAIARLLGADQFGIAATLLLLILIADMISETGADRFLVQSADGDRPEVQRTVQSVVVLRGLVQGLAMILLAWPLSWLFNTPGAATGYMALAAYPVLNGLMHLDTKRLQREGRYGPEVFSTLCGDAVSLVVGVGFAVLLRDFHAVLIGLVARAGVMTLVSHLLAERRYGLGWDRAVLGKMTRFGWPLFFTAVANFLGLQGDRGLIATVLGPRMLGVYSAAAMLLTAPVSVLSSSFTRIGLSRLSRLQGDLEAFDREYVHFTAVVFGCASIGVAGFAAFGHLLGSVLFGPAFDSPPLLYAMLGGVQALRLLRVWPTCGSFALGRTHDLMIASLVRLLSLPLALAFYFVDRTLTAVVAGLLVGETISVASALIRYNRLRGHARYHDLRLLLAFVLGVAIACGAVLYSDDSLSQALLIFAGVLLLMLAVLAVIKPSLIRVFWHLLRNPGTLGLNEPVSLG